MVTPEIEDRIARLYAYHPDAYSATQRAVKEQKNVFEDSVSGLLALTELDVFFFDNKQNFQTAKLGNRLRKTTSICRDNFSYESTEALVKIRSYLSSLVVAPDQDLLQRNLLPEKTTINPQQDTATYIPTTKWCGLNLEK